MTSLFTIAILLSESSQLAMLIEREPDAIFHPSFESNAKCWLKLSLFNHTHLHRVMSSGKSQLGCMDPNRWFVMVDWDATPPFTFTSTPSANGFPVFRRLGHLVARGSIVYGIVPLFGRYGLNLVLATTKKMRRTQASGHVQNRISVIRYVSVTNAVNGKRSATTSTRKQKFLWSYIWNIS